MTIPAVQLEHVSKYFAAVAANKDVSISVNKGEVVALLGENGAGKSTIMKILYGLYTKDEGRILINGEEVEIRSPKDAMAYGISMIQQHFSLVPTHTATENIILGNVKGCIDIRKYDEKIRKLAVDYGFEVPVDVKVGELAVGVQQKIEILKALYLNARILIMDEPTAVLTPQESDILIQFVKDFAAKGNSVVFISHKLKEVMAVADRVIVMRDGVVVDSVLKNETNEHELAKMMISQEIEVTQRPNAVDYEHAKKVLEFQHVSIHPQGSTILLDDVSFCLYSGEIFGIAGVSGNGQDELCEVIAGKSLITSGELLFNNSSIKNTRIRERIYKGIGYVPVDRYRDGMVMQMTLAENMMVKSSFDKRWQKNGLIREKELEQFTAEKIVTYRVKANGPNDKAHNLSGGNQQKMVLAREVDLGKALIVMNQPTRGLDMGAVERIHNVIMEERSKGKAVILVSTELSELFEMCDRIAVMYQGRFMGIYFNGELDTAHIGLLMAGVSDKKQEHAE
jgi:simple sugar transport system ATP-binding protein